MILVCCQNWKGNLDFLKKKKKVSLYLLNILICRVDVVVAVGKAVSFCEMGCETIIDTGTSTISVPRKDIEKINELIMADTSVFGRYKVQYCLKTLYTLVLTATVQLYSYMNYSVVFIILSVVSIF
jgi:hypothetical protein